LSEETRQEVATHLIEDRNVNWIIQNERRMYLFNFQNKYVCIYIAYIVYKYFSGKIRINKSGIIVTRSNLLTRGDVHNIKSQFGITHGKKANNDDLSVTMWVEDLRMKQELICYSKQVDKFLIGNNIRHLRC